MGVPVWPKGVDPTTKEPVVRPRALVQDTQNIRYRLDVVDIETIPGFPYVVVARRVYSDPSVEWVIRDANPDKLEKDLKVGDVILLPRNAVVLVNSGDKSKRGLVTEPTFKDIE